MNARYEIVEAKPWHVGQMIRLLRHEHSLALSSVGANAHRELGAVFDQSAFRKAWLIDGALAALGGVCGSPLDPYGQIWLALSEAAMRHPMAIVREARRQMDIIMTMQRKVVATVIAGDHAAERFALFLGFTPLELIGVAPAETRYGRRLLHRVIADTPELRAPVGASYAVTLVYAPEEAA